MADPITWKNVNQPNFASANNLLLGSTRDMSDAFSSLSDRFVRQGEFNKARNTDEAIAAASQLNDLDTFGSRRQDAMAALLGKNIDQTAVAAAYDNRRGFLQDNITFDQETDAAAFEAQNRDRLFKEDMLDRASDRAKNQAYINSVAQTANKQITGEERGMFDLAYNTASKVDPDTGKISVDDDYFSELISQGGLDTTKALKYKTNRDSLSGVSTRRAAALEALKDNKGGNSAPKNLQADVWDLDTDGSIRNKWGILDQSLKDQGYSTSQRRTIMNQGFNFSGNWDENRSEINKAILGTIPAKNKPK